MNGLQRVLGYIELGAPAKAKVALLEVSKLIKDHTTVAVDGCEICEAREKQERATLETDRSEP